MLQKVHEDQSKRVAKRKYPHRSSRKGYIGLKEEEVRSLILPNYELFKLKEGLIIMLLHFLVQFIQVKLGKIEAGEDLDRAILWKKARIPKKGSISEEQAEVNKKIVSV